MNIIITGGSSGLGKALVEACAASGKHQVLFTYCRHEDEAQALAGRFANVTAVQVDFSDEASVTHFAEMIAEKPVDVLINNAGVGDYGRFVDIPWQKERDLAGLNMIALMQMMQLYAADMEKRGDGKILNLSSIAAFNG